MYRSRNPRNPRARRKARVYRRRAIGRRQAPKRARHQVFSETFVASKLQVCSDGISAPVPAQPFAASISSMSQVAHYSALYQKYRILKLEWTIIPRFGQSEPNQAEYNVGTSGTFEGNGIVHIVKDWTSEQSPLPATELQMLQHQGVKTRLLNGRVIKVSMKYPTTLKNYYVEDISGGVPIQVLAGGVKNEWCSFDDANLYNHGNLLAYTVVSPGGNLSAIGQSCATVYCKMTFAVAEPR